MNKLLLLPQILEEEISSNVPWHVSGDLLLLLTSENQKTEKTSLTIVGLVKMISLTLYRVTKMDHSKNAKIKNNIGL